MGQTIYEGNPTSLPGTTSFQLYDKGVKIGCWGLACCSIVSAVSAGFYNISFNSL